MEFNEVLLNAFNLVFWVKRRVTTGKLDAIFFASILTIKYYHTYLMIIEHFLL